MSGRMTLVLGGVRAGKSTYAQRLASEGGRVLFVATAEAGDEEMAERIRAHKESRPAHWGTLEEPLGVAGVLTSVVDAYDTILLDCLTLLVSNLLLRESEPEASQQAVSEQVDALLALQAGSSTTWIVVSNEVGLGVIPATSLGQAFEDALGRANQRFAAQADDVVLMTAGIPQRLKGGR